MTLAAESNKAAGSRPWGRAAAWLLFLGPFFYLTYGFSNWLASQRDDVGAIVFDWETHIPFVAWTIVPYWSLNLFYTISVFVCHTRRELANHIKRLLSAQIIAVACFLLFPLQFTFSQPQADGLSGLLFSLLGAFDKPFNQAPSLHIALVVILWHLYAHRLRSVAKWLLNLWFLGIAATVLTTYQHHFIDMPTGTLLGWFCIWLWPLAYDSPLLSFRPTGDPKRRRLAGYYSAGAVLFFALAFTIGGAGLWLIWPAVSLLLVATFYLWLGAAGFQKGPNGHISIASRWLLAPYLIGAWLNSRWWTRGKPAAVEIGDDVWLGRFPSAAGARRYSIRSVVDLSAELSSKLDQEHWYAFPSLDLATVSATTLSDAAQCIERQRAKGRVLVCCALGYSRSAAAVCCWLLQTGRAQTTDDSVRIVAKANPDIVLKDEHLSVIESSFQASMI